MKKIIFACLLLALTACGTSTPDKDFNKLKQLANSNANQAINDLRIFIYHNPEHPESKILLGELLISKTHAEEREMYLAQFYLKQAIEIADEDLAAKAEDLILQAQLRRGLAPGDPEALINLAKFAEKNKRYNRSVQLFIKASYEYLYLEEFSKAAAKADDALSISNKNLIDEKPEIWLADQQESLAILASVNYIRGRLEAAKENLEKLTSPEANYEELPSTELLQVMISSADKVSAKGVFDWRPGFMKSEDSTKTVKEQDLLQALAKAEEINKDNLNKLRSTLSYHLWKSYLSTLDKSKYPEITNFVESNISFYEERVK